jgi:flagellar hook-associated protein 3 FlgL
MTSITTRGGHQAAVAQLGDLARQRDTVQGQIARARRIDGPADDPVGFARAAVLRREQAAALVTQRSIDAGNRRLGATDSALEGLGNLVQRARELALQGASGTQSAADRATIAIEIKELEAQARTLAEASDSDGQRLFGGAIAAGTTYATAPDGSRVWQGGGTAPAVAIGTDSVASGLEAPGVFGVTDAFTDTRDLFASLVALRAALAEPDDALRQAGMDTAIGDMDAHINRIANARGIIGARLGRLDAEGERLEKTKLATEADLSKLESLDMPEAIARLQRLLTVIEAAQASFVKVSSLSLWDQLR